MDASLEGLRPAEVMKVFGISRSTLWQWVKYREEFPKPIKVSHKVSIFNRKEIDAYLKKLRSQL